jgi:hypothetical protein
MRKAIPFILILTFLTTFSTNPFAAERNMLGNWSITFNGYYGNKETGPTYGSVIVTLHITKQKGRAFAGTAETSGQAVTCLLTGNFNSDKIVMVACGNTFIRGNAVDTATGTKPYLIMETQQM